MHHNTKSQLESLKESLRVFKRTPLRLFFFYYFNPLHFDPSRTQILRHRVIHWPGFMPF